MKTAQQFDQDALPIFCDKGVFRILVDIYLQKKDQFQILIQMLMDFMQPSVLNIALASIFKDLESKKVSDRQKSLVWILRML